VTCDFLPLESASGYAYRVDVARHRLRSENYSARWRLGRPVVQTPPGKRPGPHSPPPSTPPWWSISRPPASSAPLLRIDIAASSVSNDQPWLTRAPPRWQGHKKHTNQHRSDGQCPRPGRCHDRPHNRRGQRDVVLQRSRHRQHLGEPVSGGRRVRAPQPWSHAPSIVFACKIKVDPTMQNTNTPIAMPGDPLPMRLSRSLVP
jgi:hypothetical protein